MGFMGVGCIPEALEAPVHMACTFIGFFCLKPWKIFLKKIKFGRQKWIRRPKLPIWRCFFGIFLGFYFENDFLKIFPRFVG